MIKVEIKEDLVDWLEEHTDSLSREDCEEFAQEFVSFIMLTEAVTVEYDLATVDVQTFVEEACRAWWNSHIKYGQFDWDKLVSRDDHRIPGWRKEMQAALEAVGFFHLVCHHAQHHSGS